MSSLDRGAYKLSCLWMKLNPVSSAGLSLNQQRAMLESLLVLGAMCDITDVHNYTKMAWSRDHLEWLGENDLAPGYIPYFFEYRLAEIQEVINTRFQELYSARIYGDSCEESWFFDLDTLSWLKPHVIRRELTRLFQGTQDRSIIDRINSIVSICETIVQPTVGCCGVSYPKGSSLAPKDFIGFKLLRELMLHRMDRQAAQTKSGFGHIPTYIRCGDHIMIMGTGEFFFRSSSSAWTAGAVIDHLSELKAPKTAKKVKRYYTLKLDQKQLDKFFSQ